MSTTMLLVLLPVLLALQVDAQFTVDDDGACEPLKWQEEIVDLIKGEWRDVIVKQLREDFKDLKSELASNQHQNSAAGTSGICE